MGGLIYDGPLDFKVEGGTYPRPPVAAPLSIDDLTLYSEIEDTVLVTIV